MGRWEPGHSVGDARGVGVPDPDIVAAAVVEGGAQVPGILAMGGPGSSVVNFFVGYHMHYWWSYGGCIEVKAAVEEFTGLKAEG